MDSKKRPNDDIESSSDALDDQPMDVSDAILSAIVKEAATIHPPTVTVTVVTDNTVPGEPNKRVKLTMEHDKAGDYSPSTDITDPAKETKDLTEWVDHMDEDKAPILPSKETSSPVKKDDAHPATTSDNVDPVPLVSGAPTILSDSILAVASLSEPLMTTLETLENEAQATIVPTSEDKKPEEPLNQASIEETSAHSETTEPKETKEPIVTPTTEKAPPVETIYDPIKPQEAQTIEEPKEVTQPKEPMDTFEPRVPSMPETSERPPSQQGDDIIMTQAAVEDTLPTSMPFQQQPSTESVDPTPLKEPVGNAPNVVDEAPTEAVDRAPMELEKASTELEKVPTELEKVPTEFEKVPTELEKVPTELEKVPTELEKVPTELEKLPTELENAPTELEKAPNELEKTSAEPVKKAPAKEFFDRGSVQESPKLMTSVQQPQHQQESQSQLSQPSQPSQSQPSQSQPAPCPSPSQPSQPSQSQPSQTPYQQPKPVPSGPNPPSDSHRRHEPSQLPPLSTISGSQSLPSLTSHAPQPARSTMSLSALLINNDEEEDRPGHGRVSREIFDRFESASMEGPRHLQPRPPPSQAYSKTPQPQAPHAPSHSHPPSHSGHPPSHPSHPLQPPVPLHSTGPSHVVRPSGTPRRDPIEPNMRHGGYNRSPIEHGHPGRQEPMLQGPPRAPREYPADEVMESGGVSGYTGHRHRLASPVGIRPDPVAGPNGKLPGLGAMNMPSSGHEHGHHPRSEGPLPPTRPGSYSPVQHASYGNVANGIMYPPSSHSGYHGHHAPNMGQVEQPRHPRLIIHSDSLKMDGRPELFLGYHRYDPATLLPNMEGNENSLLEVRIASTYLTYDNAKVRKRELWGTEVYTDDSDVVATLIHSGFYIPPLTPTSTDQDSLQPTGQHNFASLIQHICPGFDLAVTIRAMPKLEKYQGSIQNRIKSRTWSTDDHSGASFKIESIRKLPAGEALNRGRGQSKRRIKESCTERQRVLANIHDETTESLQNERAMRTATFEFTQQGYPCFKYSPELVMDRHDGLSRKWTSWRLKSAVLILENDEERYEISLQHQAGTDSRRFDQYRFAVISPRTSLPSEATYPLGAQDLVEVLYEDLDWQDFEWVERGVVVQPSNRPKKNGAMEGVDGVATNKQEVPMEVDGDETQSQALSDDTQEGVFCVVSRLLWRSRTENRPNKESIMAPSVHKSQVKIDSPLATPEVPADNTKAIPSVSTLQLEISRVTPSLVAAPVEKVPPEALKDVRVESKMPTSVTPTPPSTLSPTTTTTTTTTTIAPPVSQVIETKPKMDVASAPTEEREEGELEEGEIASD
ncbi:MAG: hypothetical protein BYD32DRAFT_248896 [Podila humilis]|nr:MAG: hypothetical protein BYD32DRAFT_248896 [Podila humilis]